MRCRYHYLAGFFYDKVVLNFAKPFLMQAKNVFLGLGESLGAALGFVMDHDTGRLIKNFPIAVAQLEAQIDVFVAIPIAFIETLDQREGRLSDEQASRRQRLELANNVCIL